MKDRFTTLAVIFATVAACCVFASTLVHASLFSPVEEEAPAPTQSAPTTKSIAKDPEAPVRLIIPALNIDTNIQDVGRGKSGNMAVPSNYTDVGWYRYGPKPGELGSAVIDGHVDNGFALDAVFKHLHELEPGSDIFIEKKNGERLHFVVTDTKTYVANQVPLEQIFNRDDGVYLNLVTCAGDWEADLKQYNERVVVYAQME